MKISEASDLLTRCAAFDNRQPSALAAEGWAKALHDVPLDDDTFAAVDRFYGTPPKEPGQRLWIQPHDIRTMRRAIREERLTGFVYQPVEGDDDPMRYLASLRAQREAVAAGRRPAADTPQLEGGPHRDVARKLAGIGRAVPDSDDEPPRQPGPLSVSCPQCRAAIGRRCRMPGSAEKRGRERPPHAARSLSARGLPAPDADAARRESERRREASRIRLAAMQQDQTEGTAS